MTDITLNSSDSTVAVSQAGRAELAQLADEKAIAALLLRERQALIDQWTPARGGRTWMHGYSGLLDMVVRRLFALSAERVGAKSPENAPPTSGVAILAVGGYGQRLCAPHSDLDITFLSERDDNPPILHQMFPLVMDVLLSGAKIKVGYAYRTLADLRGDTLDHQTQTALLDARLVTGDAVLFQQFQTVYAEHLQIADFLFRKEAERARIRAKQGDSIFVVEPNVKEGVGGLRDVQTAAWMARVRFAKSGEALWRDLLRRRVITKADLHSLSESRELLLSVRCALHLLSGERRDVLSARRQEEVASRLEYSDEPEQDRPAVEKFMERYYAAAGSVKKIADKVMSRCLDAPLPLGTNTGLSSVRRTVAITDPARAELNPDWPIKALHYCQEYNLELGLPTEEAMERYAASDTITDSNPGAQSVFGTQFLDLLTMPGDVCATIRRMQSTTLLGAVLPELDNCMGLIPYDSSHSHTVGEHSIRVLGNLVHLRDETSDGDPFLGGYRSLFETLLSPLPLFLAALLHDIGKQWSHMLDGRRAGHEETGAERVIDICKRLGCTDAVAEQVGFLTCQHLLLARISRLRDLTQPATLREIILAVDGDRERLRMLYLLTWADTAAVGPGVWTDMSARLLDELFSRTEDAIESISSTSAVNEDSIISDTRLDSVRQRLQRQLAEEGRRSISSSPLGSVNESDDAVRNHVQLMPAVYLLNTPPGTIALHVSLIERLKRVGGVVVDMRTVVPGAAQTEMTLVTRDAPGLFAKLTGALFASDVRLHRAQAFTRSLGDNPEDIVIDTVTIDHRDRPLGPERRRIVEDALELVFSGDCSVNELLVRRRRGTTGLGIDIPIRSLQIDDQTSPDFTLVDIETQDEIGVAYRLSAQFSAAGWNIHSARISTWGGHVRCAFYLTDNDGHRLSKEMVTAHLRPLMTDRDGNRLP